MDFKTRFQGKISKISKDGGIDDMVKSTQKPINRVDKVTIRSLQPDGFSSDSNPLPPKITYDNNFGVNASSPRGNNQQQNSINMGT